MRRSGVLGERDFRNLYCARAFSLIGDGIVPVALAFGVYRPRTPRPLSAPSSRRDR